MAKTRLPNVDVAAIVITRRNRVLAVRNARWGSFTLPMTKRRKWEDPNVRSGTRQELWREAAARAGAEVLGRTLSAKPLEAPILRISGYLQGDSDGKWKRYHLQVFELPLGDKPQLAPTVVAEWLAPEDFADEDRVPISPTARYIIAKLRNDKILS